MAEIEDFMLHPEDPDFEKKFAEWDEKLDEEILDEVLAEMFEEERTADKWPQNLYRDVLGEPGDATDEEIEAVLEKALVSLTPREEIVMRMYYKDGMAIDEIGKAFGVVHARIVQIKNTAIRKLRHPHRRAILRLKSSGGSDGDNGENS